MLTTKDIDNTKQTILIIDNEVQIRRLHEINLTANGYKVAEADKAKDGCILVTISQSCTYHSRFRAS